MWIIHRVDVTKKLLIDQENALEIYFEAALPTAQKIKAAHPEHKWVGFNADMARLAVRKAQYHFVSLFYLVLATSSRRAGMGLGPSPHTLRTVATSTTGDVSCSCS
jgi:hypothetical protein